MIADFRQWLGQNQLKSSPWLLAGAAAGEKDLAQARAEGFAILALPAAAGKIDATAAFVTDVEDMLRFGDEIAARSHYVVMPAELHVGGWASGRTLEDFIGDSPALQRLADENRLYSINLWTALMASGSPIVAGDFAGEEVPLRILAEAGVKMARHCGTRAAKGPNSGFESTHSVMDKRSGGLAAVRRGYGVSYGPYGFPVPARVFVGSDDEQLMGVRVLHYSIEKYSSMDVIVEVLDHRIMPVPKDPKNHSKTGFSFCRFDIPRLCGYKGRGIYVDADMQVFTDISDMWTLPLDDVDIIYALPHPSQGRTPQTSVMLMNCEALSWDVKKIIGGLDDKSYSYKQLMGEMCIVDKDRHSPDLPYWWNSLERYEDGRTCLIHYTDMPTQPWISRTNPNGQIWYDCCAEAIESGFLDAGEVAEAVRLGHISPEIYSWIGKDVPERDSLSHQAATWIAPFNRFTKTTTAIEGSVALGRDMRLRGWAWRPAEPDEPIELAIFRDDDMLLKFAAADHGPFLERHGKGNGYHAFDFALPRSILQSNAHQFSVRSVPGDVELAGSPVSFIH